MTTPTIPPGIEHYATPLSPHSFDLLSAVTPIDVPEPARMLGGAIWIPANCGTGVGIWEHGMCPEPEEDEVKGGGERPDYDTFPKVTIWGSDECPLYSVDTADAQARALALLRINEHRLVEEHVAALLADRATVLPAAGTLVDAVGALEEALGEHGHAGVIHARRGLAAAAARDRLASAQGARLTTLLGNQWVFGGGYTALGDTLYATGPLTMWRNPYTQRVAIEAVTNARLALAERHVIVGWECPDTVYSVSIGGGS